MKLIAFDTETTAPRAGDGLCPWSDEFRVTAAGLMHNIHHPGSPARYEAQPWPTAAKITKVLEQAVAHKALVVGCNTQFDIAVCLRLGVPRELIHKVFWGDIILMWKRYDMQAKAFQKTMFKKQKKTGKEFINPLSYGLANAVKTFLPDEPEYKDFKGYDVALDTVGTPEYNDLLVYLEKDVRYTYQIAWHLLKQLRLNGLDMRAVALHSAAISQSAEAWYEGLDVSRTQVRNVYARVKKEYNDYKSVLEDNGLTSDVVRSPKKMGVLLFDQWGLPVLKTKKETGNRSTDKETLIRLRVKDDRVKALHRLRDMGTIAAKFIKAPLLSTKHNFDGKSHPSPFLYSTYTNRMTYGSRTDKKLNLPTGFALHQMKRDKDIREIIHAPNGYKIMELDYSGQEMRIMADLSGDPQMMKIFNDGMDGHSWMAAKIYGQPYDKFVAALKNPLTAKEADFQRKNGKFTNLSQQYRIGKSKMVTQAVAQYDLWIDEAWAVKLQQSYRSAFELVGEYWSKQIQFARQHGYVQAMDGSKVKLTTWSSRDSWALESTAINHPIQGTGAAMKYLAMHRLHKFVRAGAKFLFDYHDGMYYLVPEVGAEALALEMKATVDGLDYNEAWGWEPKVPMPTDLKLGYSWGTLEKV